MYKWLTHSIAFNIFFFIGYYAFLFHIFFCILLNYIFRFFLNSCCLLLANLEWKEVIHPLGDQTMSIMATIN